MWCEAVQVSTVEVDGDIWDGSFRLGEPLEPYSPYAATETSVGLLCMAYHGLLHLILGR